MDIIVLHKPFNDIIFVLPDSFHKIGSNANIECTVSLAGEEVDVGLFHS